MGASKKQWEQEQDSYCSECKRPYVLPETKKEAKKAPRNAYLAAQVRDALNRVVGRRYQIDVSKLDLNSLREIQRMLRDVDQEITSIKSRARNQPWRFRFR